MEIGKLHKLNLEDVLKVLPRRVKYITIWHYLEIKRGPDAEHKWRVIYGEHEFAANKLRTAAIDMLMFLAENNFAPIDYRYERFIEIGYIKLDDNKDEEEEDPTEENF